MAPLVIDRASPTMPVDTLLSFFGDVHYVIVEKKSAGRIVLSPAIDPNDYETEGEYINAIPGMREKILEGINTPLSECIDVPDDWIDLESFSYSERLFYIRHL